MIDNLITQPCEYLGAPAGLISAHTIPINFNFGLKGVYFLDIVPFTKDTSA